MTGPAVVLAFGVILAALGGEFFLRGMLSLAASWRVPPGLVGVTVGAFGTSAPEFSVGVNSALANRPEIVLGDVLGSNIVNIGLILGVALLFGPVAVDRGTVSRDLPAESVAEHTSSELLRHVRLPACSMTVCALVRADIVVS